MFRSLLYLPFTFSFPANTAVITNDNPVRIALRTKPLNTPTRRFSHASFV
ncbi:hypothetical protein AZ270_gp77 [Acidianus tailed spindle virus]|nr:hypothetical protein AZ270_gp77 [Acidianus tailed spindle virus]AME30100.1 hypothetical protein ATSV_A49 [Acidianus tailed spindle virus]